MFKPEFKFRSVTMVLAVLMAFITPVWAQNFASKTDTAKSETNAARIENQKQAEGPVAPSMPEPIKGAPATVAGFDPLKYTLGPEDSVEILVMRHPEFSGTYQIDKEGKLQYKFVGDLKVTGMTKTELEAKVKEIISKFVIAPEVNVTITDYRSKVFYVLGEVGQPGKYYMMSETISARDAVVMAGLPTQSAAMRKSQIITPSDKGGRIQNFDLYAVLYSGDLNKDLVIHPGEFLYVPSTVMAKMFRVISPVTSVVGSAAGVPSGSVTGRDSTQQLQNNNNR